MNSTVLKFIFLLFWGSTDPILIVLNTLWIAGIWRILEKSGTEGDRGACGP